MVLKASLNWPSALKKRLLLAPRRLKCPLRRRLGVRAPHFALGRLDAFKTMNHTFLGNNNIWSLPLEYWMHMHVPYLRLMFVHAASSCHQPSIVHPVASPWMITCIPDWLIKHACMSHYWSFLTKRWLMPIGKGIGLRRHWVGHAGLDQEVRMQGKCWCWLRPADAQSCEHSQEKRRELGFFFAEDISRLV
jgi:hypothetical protein